MKRAFAERSDRRILVLDQSKFEHRGGVRICGLEAIDLVITDYHMPVMNGIESAQKILQDPQTNQPVIVALTSDTSAQTRDDCFAAGMRDFMPKPLQLDHLKSFIAKVWSRQFNQEN